jgi:HSP20 family protein
MAIENLVPWRRSSSLTPSAVPSSPLSSISSLQREMNRMFNNLWTSPPMISQIGEESTSFFYPDVEMSETDGHIEVSAELPGVSEKDIDVTLSPDGNTLSIKGEKKIAKEKKEKDYYCAERTYGAFRRTMSLPATVNSDKVDAKFRNGVLEIKLNKVDDKSKGIKHIDIKAS